VVRIQTEPLYSLIHGTFNLTGITSTIPVKSLGVVTYSKIQDFINTTLSSGRISGGELVNNGNGTLNILLGSGMIKTSDILLVRPYFLIGQQQII
jgi:hypothetical protein